MTLSIIHTPAPTVLLSLTDLPTAAARTRVERVWGSHVEEIRESATALPSGGGLVVRDYEAPLGQGVSYRVTAYAADGQVLSTTLTEPVSVPDLPDCSTAWIMDSLVPSTAILLPLMSGSLRETELASDTRMATPLTGGLLVAALRPRTSRVSRLILRTETKEDGYAMEELIAPGGVLVLRGRAGLMRATGILRVAAQSVTREQPWLLDSRSLWHIRGVEVAADAWPGVVPLMTWADGVARASGITWAQAMALHAGQTWLDGLSDDGVVGVRAG